MKCLGPPRLHHLRRAGSKFSSEIEERPRRLLPAANGFGHGENAVLGYAGWMRKGHEAQSRRNGNALAVGCLRVSREVFEVHSGGFAAVGGGHARTSSICRGSALGRYVIVDIASM